MGNRIPLMEDVAVNEGADDVYIIKTENTGKPGRDKYVKGTLADLVGYFSYTLEIGNSYKKSIQREPKTIAAFVKSLQAAYGEKEANIYNRTFVELVTEVPDGASVSDQTALK